MAFCCYAFFFQNRQRTKKFLLVLCLIVQIFIIVLVSSFHQIWSSPSDRETLHSFVVDTVGCKIPNIDPFDATVYHLVNSSASINCNSTPSMTYTDGKFLRINRTSLDLFYDDELDYCEFETIYRPTDDERTDNAFRYKRAVRFSDDVDAGSEFVRVACYGRRGSLMYTNFHAFIIRKEDVEKRCERRHERFLNEQQPKEVFNFLILGMDSISRLNFIRQMPATRSFLMNEMSAVELQGYNKVADNTYVNLVPMFAGQFVEELPWDERYSDVPFDNFTFFWNNLSDIGYRTLYAEDAPQIAIFNYNKAGFHRPPTDYYLRPFSLALEDHGSMWKNDHDCVGNKLETEIVLDWISEFEARFKDEPHMSFAFITRLTHDNVNKARLADEPYRRFFERLHDRGLVDNSLVIFYSDHGMRFGDIRQTYVGKMEERLPFMYVALPRRLVENYPEMATALRKNANWLTTPFDVYETLVELINFRGSQRSNVVSRRGMTLLSEIPSERNCEHAAIFPHWCACHETSEVSFDDEKVLLAAHRVVYHINDLLTIYGTKCATLSLAAVKDARKIIPNDRLLRYESSLHDVIGRTVRFVSPGSEQKFVEYQLVITTHPSDAMFEATVKLYERKETSLQVSDISRINEYGRQSECIDFHTHKKFCYCL